MVKVCDIACDEDTYFLVESDAKEFGEKLAKAITDCKGFRYKSKLIFVGDSTVGKDSGP